jgi:hypothetical protein
MRSLAARRFLLAGLLAAATLLFAIGVTAERSADDEAGAPAASVEASEGGHAEEDAEAAHSEAAESGEGERLLGVDAESTLLVVLAVLAGLALSVASASELRRRPWFLATVAIVALAWAVLDVRELVHQLDESNGGIATVAAVVAALHFAAAAVAGAAERDTLGEFKST